MKQMQNRDIPIKHPPIWAWVKKPDLRHSCHLAKGKKGVRLSIDVPDELVLLSEFNAWHFVLNDTYLPPTNNEYENDYNQEQKEISWINIFSDKADILKGIAYDNDPYYQATFPYLKKKWVLKTDFFTGR